jgi:predicted dehydrogenase
MHKVAIIGLWRQGKIHLEAIIHLEKLQKVELLAVCDIDKIFIEALVVSEHTKKYNSSKELLQIHWNDLDLLITSLPNSEYLEVINFSKQYKYKILKEKPYASNQNEYSHYQWYDNLIIAQQRFFMRSFQTAKQRIENDKIWRVLFFDYFYCLNDTKESWYRNQEQGWWAWINIWRHFLFVVFWFLWDIKSFDIKKLQCNKRGRAYNTDDTNIITFTNSEWTIWRWFLSVVDVYKQKNIQIIGEKWTILIIKNKVSLLDNHEKIIEEHLEFENLEIYSNQILFALEWKLDKLHKINTDTMQYLSMHF